MSADNLPALDLSGALPAPASIDEIETPAVLIDLDVAERNLVRWQAFCDAHGLANRPHVKTHKLIPLARRQLELGASGITCQKIGEAEVMADGGMNDILITFNILSAPKLSRLTALARRVCLTVVADSEIVAQGLSQAAAGAGVEIRVLVECDTGGGRCGVLSPQDAVQLARSIDRLPGISFAGFMTYPAPGSRIATCDFLARAREACERSGLAVQTISTGGSPDMWSEEGLDGITEYRAGTYVYNDRKLVKYGVAGLDDCALTVLATVVSAPRPDRAVIDAGSKALTCDLMGMTDHGAIVGHPLVIVARLNEEHGVLDLANAPGTLATGDRIRIVPNHACVVSNMFDVVHLVRNGAVIAAHPVDARGRVT